MTFAKFTRDMTETLVTFFHCYERDGVVTLQVTERGLWLVNPVNGTRQFLGRATLPDAERERSEAPRAGPGGSGLH